MVLARYFHLFLTAGLLAICLAAIGCRQESTKKQTVAPVEEPAVQKPIENAPPVPSEQADPAAAFKTLRDQFLAGQSEKIVSAISQPLREGSSIWIRQWTTIDVNARKSFIDSLIQAAGAVAAKESLISQSKTLVFDGPWSRMLNDYLASCARTTAAVAKWPGWLATDSFDTDGMIRAFVEAIAAEPELRAALARIEFETVSVSDDQGVVRYRTSEDGTWKTIVVSLHEETWIPTQWKQHANPNGAELKSGSKSDAAERLRTLADRLDQLSTTLEHVSSQAEFDAIIEQAATRLLAEKPTREPTPRKVPEEQFAWVVVSGELSAQQQDQLLWNIAQRTDAPASAVADSQVSDDGASIRIHVGPVADLRAFAERLTGLVIDEINEKQRTIRAHVGPDRSL